MNDMTRRRFLIKAGMASGAGLAAAGGLITFEELTRRSAASPPAPAGTGILVVLTLYGGNDGLNTVVPYADPAYASARQTLAYKPDEVLKLDDTLGLNPMLKGTQALWAQHKVAIVRGVEYPNPDFSHFRSMDIWQTASPDQPIQTGWIGRWLDATGADPLHAINVGSVLPPLAIGARTSAVSLQTTGSSPLPAIAESAITGLGVAGPGDSTTTSYVTASFRAERTAAQTLSKLPTDTSPTGTDLQKQLDLVARCIKAGVPASVYSVDLGNFDTHADEKGTHETQLADLDTSVSQFMTQLDGDPRRNDVVLLVYSEFGRRVTMNASNGTDHGSSGPVFVIGDRVKGGFYGEQPSMTNLDNGNLRSSVDFRSVYGEMLHRVLGADPQQILSATKPELGVLA